MRELKFRAWKEVNGKMHRWICPPIPRASDFIEISRDMDIRNFIKGADVIEQYTGLKDKNGKEIYEGDIVHYTERIAPNKSSTYEVYYDRTHAMYALSPVDGKIDVGEFYGYIMRQQYEVIGNIHENPELLEGKK